MDGDRSTPPCPDGSKPNTCADGSAPTKGRPGGGRPGRCPKEDQVCCDGSTPAFDGDRHCGTLNHVGGHKLLNACTFFFS